MVWTTILVVKRCAQYQRTASPRLMLYAPSQSTQQDPESASAVAGPRTNPLSALEQLKVTRQLGKRSSQADVPGQTIQLYSIWTLWKDLLSIKLVFHTTHPVNAVSDLNRKKTLLFALFRQSVFQVLPPKWQQARISMDVYLFNEHPLEPVFLTKKWKCFRNLTLVKERRQNKCRTLWTMSDQGNC